MRWDLIEFLKASLACAVCIAFALGWLYFSHQKTLSKSVQNCLAISTRVILIHAIAFFFCAWIGVPVNVLVILSVMVLALSPSASVAEDSPLNKAVPDEAGFLFFTVGVIVLAPVFILKQFVLGFPDRDHLVLRTPQTKGRSKDFVESSSKSTEIKDEPCTVVATLKPMGQIQYQGSRRNAVSFDGSMIEVGQIVTVCGRNNQLLLVQPYKAESE